MDVRPRGEIHHRIRAPERRPAKLLDLLLDRRTDGRIADVGVDLHEEVTTDDHRLEFGMIDIGRDDGAAARHLGPHQFRRQPLASGDKRHLRRHLAPTCVVELRTNRTRSTPGHQPRLTQLWQTGAHVVPLGTARVVQTNRGMPPGERNLAGRYLQGGPGAAGRKLRVFFVVDFDRVRKCCSECGHALPPPVSAGSGSKGVSQSSWIPLADSGLYRPSDTTR